MRNVLKNDNDVIISKDGKELLDKPQMNKNCPCGSKKKYKACCHSAD